MTDETIEFIVDLINAGKASDFIFMRPVSNNVHLGRVWINSDKGDICTDSGYSMFFIQDKQKVTVAAVVDMGRQDLHVFVHPEHRRKGHLGKALRSVILPYLFAEGREEQRVTFQTENAMRHAEKLGFHLTSEGAAKITPEDLPTRSAPCLGTLPPSEHQIERIKKRISFAADLLRMARDDIESAFGEGDVWEGLDYLASDIADEVWTIRDLWDDIKNGKRQDLT